MERPVVPLTFYSAADAYAVMGVLARNGYASIRVVELAGGRYGLDLPAAGTLGSTALVALTTEDRK